MTIEIESSPAAAGASPRRDIARAVLCGLAQRCPACGKPTLFDRYLKVAHACRACGEALHHHRADDAPPYFTIMIVGHIVVGAALALEKAVQPSTELHLALWVPLTVLLCLVLLPRIKGALVGLQWALRMHGFGAGPDPGLPAEPGHGAPGPRPG